MEDTRPRPSTGATGLIDVEGARPHAPFGPDPIPAGTDVVSVPTAVGPLTALVTRARVTPAARDTDTGRGRVLVVPGFTGSKEDFTHFVPLLARAGYSTLVYSQRGQADSAAPFGRWNYRLTDFVGDLLEVARRMGADAAHPVHLLGHSFGGVVSRAATIADPSLFRTLTLFSSGPRATPAAVSPLLVGALPPGPVGRHILMRVLHADMPEEPQADPRLEMLRRRAQVTSSANVIGIARILLTYGDSTRALAATGVPVHLVHGAEDEMWPAQWYPPEAEALGATLTPIPHAEHSAQLEAPEALSRALVAFWDAHS